MNFLRQRREAGVRELPWVLPLSVKLTADNGSPDKYLIPENRKAVIGVSSQVTGIRGCNGYMEQRVAITERGYIIARVVTRYYGIAHNKAVIVIVQNFIQ
jgi:hypothetical protein